MQQRLIYKQIPCKHRRHYRSVSNNNGASSTDRCLFHHTTRCFRKDEYTTWTKWPHKDGKIKEGCSTLHKKYSLTCFLSSFRFHRWQADGNCLCLTDASFSVPRQQVKGSSGRQPRRRETPILPKFNAHFLNSPLSHYLLASAWPHPEKTTKNKKYVQNGIQTTKSTKLDTLNLYPMLDPKV